MLQPLDKISRPFIVPSCVAMKRIPNSTVSSNGNQSLKLLARSVRSLPIKLLTVGKTRSPGVQLVVQEYLQKLRPYCTVEDIQIKSNPKKTSITRVQVEEEDAKAIHHITPKDWVVLLDEKGKDTTSEELANIVGDTGEKGASALVFCIGGPYGHGQKLRNRADVSIKLSSMVLNHQVALIVTLEQLYRSWTILKGQKYHHI